MRQLILIIILIFSWFVLKAQKTSAELEKQLKTAGKTEQISILNSLAGIYITDSPDKAIDCAESALKLARFRKVDKSTEAQLYQILGEAYFYKMDYKNALSNYEKELKTIDKSRSTEEEMKSFFNIAIISQRLKKNKKAAEYYQKSLKIAEALNAEDIILLNYLGLTEVYSDIGRHEKAMEYFQKYISLRDKELDREVNKKIQILSRKYKSEKRQKQQKEVRLRETKDSLDVAVEKEIILVEDTLKKATKIRNITEENRLKDIAIEEKEHRIAAQKRLLYSFVTFLIIVFVFLLILFWLYRLKQKANKELNEKNIQITEQKNVLKEQRDTIADRNKEIKDSILYAFRIQTALLPPQNIIEELLHDYFIFFKPRDIVSGDYYWIAQLDKKIIIVAADCTGHGVPGAFMSMLGVAFLNEIVEKELITEPDKILNRMREQVITSLQQEKGDTRDGMDVVVLTIDVETNILQFAGANNPLYLIRKIQPDIPLSPLLAETDESKLREAIENSNFNKSIRISASRGYVFTQMKGDKMPVGIYDDMRLFKKHELKLIKGDAIYIFSDGYVDQFGGSSQKKLKYNAFRQFLLDNQNKTMNEQKQVFKKFFEDWKGDLEQVDDILVIGLKI